MNITLVTVGKIKEKYFRDAIAEYQKRLSKYCRLEIVEVAGCREGEIQLNILYTFEETGEDGQGSLVGRLQERGSLWNEEKLRTAGLS